MSNQKSAYIVHPEVTGIQSKNTNYMMEEAKGLAAAISLEVLELKSVKVSKVQAGAFLGKGQRQIIGSEIEELRPNARYQRRRILAQNKLKI